MSELEQAIRAARDEFEPSPSDRARVKQRLLAKAVGGGLMASLATKASAGTTLTTSTAGQSLPVLSKLLFGSMLVTFAGAGVVVAVTRNVSTSTDERPTVVATAAAPAAPAAPAASAAQVAPNERTVLAPSEPAIRAVPAAPSSRAASPPITLPAPAASHLGAELEAELSLLRDARLASNSGDVERARRVLDDLDVRHPRGLLLEERSALRAMTDCQGSGSTARAEDFLRRHPASVYASNVRRTCRIEAAPGPVPSAATATFTDPPGAGH